MVVTTGYKQRKGQLICLKAWMTASMYFMHATGKNDYMEE
jgi:hypothetical protein